MMKRILASATTKLVDVACYTAAKTNGHSDDEHAEALTDGGEAIAATDAPDAPDAETLLYADDDEFDAAFGDAWPGRPGDSLTWLVEEGETGPLLIAYDRGSDSDDEFLQAPAHGYSDGESDAAER